MHFIEALKLRSKLFFLFILITIGLIAVGVLGAINIKSMKKNVDSIYFGSLVPTTELNEILQIYHGNLASYIYKARSSEITVIELNTAVNRALEKIELYWKNYESHFKRDDEKKYLEYVAKEIENTNNYFRKIIISSKVDGSNLQNISLVSFEKHMLHIHMSLKKLINYEGDVAKYERNKFLNVYNDTLLEVGLVLLIIVIAVLLISYQVFKSIQIDQTRLEITTKKLKHANKKLENVSYTDSLTSLHNRRYFNFVYDKEFKRSKRNESYITFMMLDIDFFKQYNDTYGHIEGDFALRSVAKVLKDTLQRPSDFVFRLGGEEFGVLLTDTNEENSAALAQNICDAIRGREIKHETSKANEFVTISIGVVCCLADSSLDENALISNADKMLYEAKENGRNCYVMSTDACIEKKKNEESA